MSKSPLNEIVLYRAIVILLLIATHSFTIFGSNGGDWPYPNGISSCNYYKWILHFFAHAMLGGFTFISGYLLMHQREKVLHQSWKTFVVRKLHRLLLPGILFSLLYWGMFEDRTFSAFIRLFYKLGTGHMWYLPMLMWCLIFGYYLLKHSISLNRTILFTAILLFLYFLPLPFGLPRFFYYAIYFIFGMIAYKHRSTTINRCKLYLNGGGGYLLTFILATSLYSYLRNLSQDNLLSEFLIKETSTYIRVYSGIIGVWLYWQISLYVVNRHILPFWIRSISRYSFGIYLYQQFILQILLYHTSMPQLIGTIALPWICFAITLLLSWGLAWLTSKTRIGKYLLG